MAMGPEGYLSPVPEVLDVSVKFVVQQRSAANGVSDDNLQNLQEKTRLAVE